MTRQIKDRGMIRVKNKAGLMIPKPSIGLFRPKPQRYYNYALDADGSPYAADMDRMVPRDQYHMRLLVQGALQLIDEPKEVPTEEPSDAPTEAPKKATKKSKQEDKK